MGPAGAEGTMRGPAWHAGIAPHARKTGETVDMVYVLARNRTIRSVMEATCWSPVLAQRAVSEDPRWTRAVRNQTGRLQ